MLYELSLQNLSLAYASFSGGDRVALLTDHSRTSFSLDENAPVWPASAVPPGAPHAVPHGQRPGSPSGSRWPDAGLPVHSFLPAASSLGSGGLGSASLGSASLGPSPLGLAPPASAVQRQGRRPPPSAPDSNAGASSSAATLSYFVNPRADPPHHFNRNGDRGSDFDGQQLLGNSGGGLTAPPARGSPGRSAADGIGSQGGSMSDIGTDSQAHDRSHDGGNL